MRHLSGNANTSLLATIHVIVADQYVKFFLRPRLRILN
jgi:hypothetical protein